MQPLRDPLLRVALAIPLAYEGCRMLWIALRFYLPAGVSPWLLVFAAFSAAAVVLLAASASLVAGHRGRLLWLAVVVWALALGVFEVYARVVVGYFAFVPATEELVLVLYAAVLAIAFFMAPPAQARSPNPA
ncbi:MAG TPA: hypothetical protein VMT50_11100 [Steroidobacteraceae bacterium]|nr:hypothetical protein [Steroidobacteraceae bacterium]